MKIVVVSGGFDPIHAGHIEYMKSAKGLGDKLIVALNSDKWLINKKNFYFLSFEERKLILENLTFVDSVINFEDDVQGSAVNALIKIKTLYPNDEIIFANGGDRNSDNTSEMSLDGIEFAFSVGGNDKKNSSSSIVKNWKYSHEQRIWGLFYDLFEESRIKVKQLIVHPKNNTSFQRHFKRSELYFVSEGSCIVNLGFENNLIKEEKKLNKYDHLLVPVGEWHQIINPNNTNCKIIEVQFGDECSEGDIERKEI